VAPTVEKACRWTTRQGVESPPFLAEAHRQPEWPDPGRGNDVSKLLGSGVVDLLGDHTNL
jgi:hypothetical protein